MKKTLIAMLATSALTAPAVAPDVPQIGAAVYGLNAEFM